MGLEILEQVEDVDAIIVPVGGCGLIAGLAVAVKSLYPHCQIIVRHSHIVLLLIIASNNTFLLTGYSAVTSLCKL